MYCLYALKLFIKHNKKYFATYDGNCTLHNTGTPSYYVNLNRVQLSQTQRQVRYRGAIVWNELPSELKELMSYMNFYNATYTYFINDLVS